MRFGLGLILALALAGQSAAETLDFEVPPPAVVPVLAGDAQVAPVSFSRMAANLAEGQGLVDRRSGYFACMISGKFTDPDFERLFRSEFAKAGLKVSGDQTNLFEQDTKTADLQNTVTRGIVSGMRTIDGESFIQSDAPITHGDSGGPLLDDKGAVVGLSDFGTDPALKVLALQPAG